MAALQKVSTQLPLEIQAPQRKPVNLRSVLLGLLGVIFICTLTPYNDWAVNNTYLVGNYLPVGLLLFFLPVSSASRTSASSCRRTRRHARSARRCTRDRARGRWPV